MSLIFTLLQELYRSALTFAIVSVPHFFLIASPGGLGSMEVEYRRVILEHFPLSEIVILRPAGFSRVFSEQFYKDKAADRWWLKSGAERPVCGKCGKFVTHNLITFSAGYGYPREHFNHGGIDFFDTYTSIDSIHGTKKLNNVKQFERFAAEKHLFLIHTDIDPYTYASTTDVKNHLQSKGLNFYTYHVPGNDKWAHIRALREAGPKVLRDTVLPFIKEGKVWQKSY